MNKDNLYYLSRYITDILLENELNDDIMEKIIKYIVDEACTNSNTFIYFISSTSLTASLNHAINTSNTLSSPVRIKECRQKLGKNIEFSEKNIIIILINGPAMKHTRRDHWSLLIFFRDMNTLYHYDSFIGINEKKVKFVAIFLKWIGVIPNHVDFLEPYILPKQLGPLVCGLYVLYYTTYCCENLKPISDLNYETFNEANVTSFEFKSKMIDILMKANKKQLVKLL